MVEVPAAALGAAALASRVDFLSIGTNDLVQYTMAAERGNAGVARLSDPVHPAVLRLIAAVTDAASRHACRVAVCGEAGVRSAVRRTAAGIHFPTCGLGRAAGRRRTAGRVRPALHDRDGFLGPARRDGRAGGDLELPAGAEPGRRRRPDTSARAGVGGVRFSLPH